MITLESKVILTGTYINTIVAHILKIVHGRKKWKARFDFKFVSVKDIQFSRRKMIEVYILNGWKGN